MFSTNNPQSVNDHFQRIGIYLFNKEKGQTKLDLNECNYIDFAERSKTIDWLTIIGVNFNLLEKTLGLAIECFDLHLQKKGMNIDSSEYQFIGLSSLFMASKYEEIYPPNSRVYKLKYRNSL